MGGRTFDAKHIRFCTSGDGHSASGLGVAHYHDALFVFHQYAFVVVAGFNHNRGRAPGSVDGFLDRPKLSRDEEYVWRPNDLAHLDTLRLIIITCLLPGAEGVPEGTKSRQGATLAESRTLTYLGAQFAFLVIFTTTQFSSPPLLFSRAVMIACPSS